MTIIIAAVGYRRDCPVTNDVKRGQNAEAETKTEGEVKVKVRTTRPATLNVPARGRGRPRVDISEQAVRVATRYALSSPVSASRAAEQTQRSIVSHAQYVLTVTAAPASRLKAALSKAAW